MIHWSHKADFLKHFVHREMGLEVWHTLVSLDHFKIFYLMSGTLFMAGPYVFYHKVFTVHTSQPRKSHGLAPNL